MMGTDRVTKRKRINPATEPPISFPLSPYLVYSRVRKKAGKAARASMARAADYKDISCDADVTSDDCPRLDDLRKSELADPCFPPPSALL